MAPRARQAKGKARITRYEEMLAEEQAAEKRDDKREITIPPGPRLGDVVINAKGLRKGYGDNLLMDDVDVHAAARRHRRRDRAERRRQDDPVPHDPGPREARRRRAEDRRDGRALLRRPVAREAGRRALGLGGDLGRRQGPGDGRQARDELARVRGVLRLPRARPAEAGEGPLGRRAKPPAPRDAAEERRQPAARSTSPRTTSTSTPCARSRRRSSTSPAAPS